MTFQDLEKLRQEKWRVNGIPVTTLEDARAFLDSVGICLMYPQTPPVLLPTLLGATIGDERGLPNARQAFADERTHHAQELANRLLAERAAFESNLFPGNPLLLSRSVFPYFYALVRERTHGSARRDDMSQLARLAWKLFEAEGPLTRDYLREKLGAELTIAAVERALGELWMRLRIVPVERGAAGERWDSLQRWAPQQVNEAARLSLPAALSALISQYLQAAVAAEPREIEEFFSHLAPRSKAKDAVNAMLAAREFTIVNVGHHALVQVATMPPAQTLARPRPPRPPRRRPA